MPTGIIAGLLRAVSSHVVAHWNGSQTLLHTLLIGGGIALLVILLILALPRPSNAVAHYQTMGIIGVFQLAGPMASPSGGVSGYGEARCPGFNLKDPGSSR